MFVNLFKRAPFLRLLPFLVAGILAQHYFQPGILPVILLLLFTVIGLTAAAYLPPHIRFFVRTGQGAAVYLAVYLLGHLALYLKDDRHHPQWMGRAMEDSSLFVVTVTEPLVEKPASWKALATVTSQWKGTQQEVVKGDVVLYFRKDSVAPPGVGYGSRLLVGNRLKRIGNAGNPGAFDYSAYCARNNIFYQAYLQPGDWVLLPGSCTNTVAGFLLRTKAYCLSVLRRYVVGKEEAGIAQALLIGYREELDKSVVQAYTNTGVVHIIAISGLHLGLIYVTLLWCLMWLPDNGYAGWLKVLIILSVLWGFSVITGASASVLRSAVMFTTIAIGQFLMGRYTNIYNTLAASAFLLLCYNPCFIVDVGFQLSYLAVLSILVFYRPVYELWDIRYSWLDKLWQMVAVSLAAQLLTVPVCLYYFHQFPNLFLLANLVAVPVSTVILYGEILLMIFGPVAPVAIWLGKGVEWGIAFMNGFIGWINCLPFALTDNLWMSGAETLVLYVCMATLAVWWLGKQKYAMMMGVGLLAVLAFMHTWYTLEARWQRRFIVYNVPKQSALGFVQGRRQQLVADSAALAGKSFHIRPSQLLYRVREGNVPAFARRGDVIQFCNMKMVIVSAALNYQPSSHKLKTDYVLLSHNPPVTISQLKEQFEFSMVIIDASNQQKRIQNWKNDCKALTLRCFSVPDEGAFVLNL